MQRWLLNHIPEFLIYGFLALAIALIFLGGVPFSHAADLHGVAYTQAQGWEAPPEEVLEEDPEMIEEPAPLPRPVQPRPRPRVRVAVPPLPSRGVMPASPVVPLPEPGDDPGNPTLRAAYLRCSSYFTIYANVVREIAEEEAAVHKQRAIELLRAASAPGVRDRNAERTTEESNRIFLEVFSEYQGLTTAGAGLYDKYNETCEVLVKGLPK